MLLVLVGLCLAPTVAFAQVSFEQAIEELSSPQPEIRLQGCDSAQRGRVSGSGGAAGQGCSRRRGRGSARSHRGELNIFLATRIVPKKKVGLVVEVRAKIAAEAAFSAGPLALGAMPVPVEVLTALRTAARDDNPRVGLEALYAFGALASEATGGVRRELRQAVGYPNSRRWSVRRTKRCARRPCA